jgi:hypothetical protein
MIDDLFIPPIPEGRTEFCNDSFHLVNHFGKGWAGVSDHNLYDKSAPLPSPYDPVDQARMTLPYQIPPITTRMSFGARNARIGGIGKARRRSANSISRKFKILSRKLSKCKKKIKKLSKKLSKRKRKNSFGITTPGTPEWSNSTVKGFPAGNNIALYENINKTNIVPNVIGMPNVPMQFSNNQLNSPDIASPVFNFGKRKKSNNIPKRRPRLSSHKGPAKKGPKFSVKKGPKLSVKKGPVKKGPAKKDPAKKDHTNNRNNLKRNFGLRSLVPSVAGPNTAGYNTPFLTYRTGANTMDFLKNKEYYPNIASNEGKVQGDGMTPDAWLNQSKGLGEIGKGLGNGFGKNSNLVYSFPPTSTGRNVIAQPPSPNFSNSFGRSNSFGNKVISLDSSGKITIG